MKYRTYRRDSNRRNLFKKTEIFQKVLKALFKYCKNNYLKLIVQKINFIKLLPNNYKTRIQNSCVISGRSRGIYREFKCSRILIRKLGSEGLFFGLKKAS
jgi:small subunit ribosomal protein S14